MLSKCDSTNNQSSCTSESFWNANIQSATSQFRQDCIPQAAAMADLEEEPIICPWCDYITTNKYQIDLHVETLHSEGESPFLVKDDASIAAVMASNDDEIQYASCPVENCGEAILLTELESHIEMHGAEGEDTDVESDLTFKKEKIEDEVKKSFSTKLSYALRNLEDVEDSSWQSSRSASHPSDLHAETKAAWKNLLNMPDSSSNTKSKTATSIISTAVNGPQRRLGKSELGPHANEAQMPSWLVKLLKESDGAITTINRLSESGRLKKVRVCVNQAPGILPVLRQLLEQDASTAYAYLCHPNIKHVSKLRREGGFCGYRNIQMLSSYIIGVKSQGHENFNDKIPTIFDIQEYIETAWDLGFNSHGRAETGGIRGTRKYIGTPDAQAMLCSLSVACETQAFKTKKGDRAAESLVFEFVEGYFKDGAVDFDSKVRLTSLPPIYFQHPGHSMTIVGFEKKRDGSRNLMVFDPMFHDASDVLRHVDAPPFKHKYPGKLLKAYRRGVQYLKKYNEFEVLKLTPPLNQSGEVTKGVWEIN